MNRMSRANTLTFFAVAGIVVLFLAVATSAPAQCDPQVTPQKLIGSSTTASDFYGIEVEAQGDLVVVGAQSAEAAAPNGGAAFVFRNLGGIFEEETTLLASDADTGDAFGKSVSVDGDIIVVGAWFGDASGFLMDTGAVYVFRFDGTEWPEEQKLSASDAATGNEFGCSASVSGNVIIVGDRFGDSSGIDNSGSAYVYRHDGSVWQEEAILFSTQPDLFDGFGRNVCVDGDVVIVGAPGDDDLGGNAGACYVFRHDGVSWNEEIKLVASDGGVGDFFGIEVSVDGDVIIVGASGDDVAGSNSGSAYVFRFDGSSWVEETKLTPSDPGADDNFGISVAVSGSTAVVGADSDDDLGDDSGSAYVFTFDGTGWAEECKLTAFDGATGDQFGFSVSIDGDTTAVGAFRDDDAGNDAGSMFVYNDSSDLLLRGDADGDGTVNGLVDALAILGFQFGGGPPPPCMESADSDGNGTFNGLVDGLYVLNFQFAGGPPPPPPFPACGSDPDPAGTLGCLDHPGCT